MLIKPFIGDYKLNTRNLFGANPQYYKQFSVKHPDGTRKPLTGHNGIDWLLPHGTVVVSPITGRVVEVAFDENGYGNYIKIENDKCGVILAHLEKVEVAVGFQVNQGQRIATSDNTGYSTGPHLHEGFYLMPRDRSNGYGGFIDPVPYHTDINNETYEVTIAGDNPIPKEQPVTEETPEPSRPPEEGKLYTKTEYDACMADRKKFWEERDRTREELQAKIDEFDELNSIYTEIKAMGFENADDIQKALDKKDKQITAQQTELTQVLNRNTVILEQLKKKDEEDASAIEAGIDAIRRVKELEADLRHVQQAVNVDPEEGISGIAKLITNIKEMQTDAKKAVVQVQKETNVSDEQRKNTAKMFGFEWLLKILGLTSIIIFTAGTTYFFGSMLFI